MILLKYITVLKGQLESTPLYQSSNYRLSNGEDVWIQYFKGDLKPYTYNIDGMVDVCGVPSVIIIRESDDNKYAAYRYCGNVSVTRKIENAIVYDTINNLSEIETNIIGINDAFQESSI